MRASLSNRTKLICGILFTFAVMALLVLGSRNDTSVDTSACFLGFTNVPGKGRCAMFAITNTSGRRIGLCVDSFDESLSGAWSRRALASGSQLTPQAHTWLSSFVGWKDCLRPDEGFVFGVPSPTANAAWRIRFTAQEQEALADRAREWIGEGAAHSIVLNGRVFSGRRYTFLSPEVAP